MVLAACAVPAYRMPLPSAYLTSATDLAYVLLCAYAMSGTDLSYAAPVPFVLTSRMLQSRRDLRY
eukprot:3189239-Rhodomonas_salina.5